MNVPGFTSDAVELVNEMLFAERENPYEGKCGQKKLRQQNKQARTPAQQQADRSRAQANRGKDNIDSSTRSQAAQKAAETRRRCKGGSSSSGPTT